jgi:hypothetical protein
MGSLKALQKRALITTSAPSRANLLPVVKLNELNFKEIIINITFLITDERNEAAT